MPQRDLKNATDADLLACFAAGRDRRAFAEIVTRHGPMVMGVARRLLKHEQDAEDAFQATFLALAGAAGRRSWRPTIAGWLHQTVVRSARSIGRANARWHHKIERRKRVVSESYSMPLEIDLANVLDEELWRLPEACRAAVVICDLEGLSRADAAGRLGIPVATVKTRLARGRKLLRARLVRRGVRVAGGGLVIALAGLSNGSGSISPALADSTLNHAIHFAAGRTASEIGVSTTVVKAAQGVIRVMKLSKLTMIGAAALAMVFSVGSVDTVAGLLSSVAKAETILFDDFKDGSATDGLPMSWATPFTGFLGALDASSGDLVLTPTPPGRGTVATPFPQLLLGDVSIRAQARILESSPQVQGLELLARGSRPSGNVYQAGVNENGLAYITTTLRRSDYLASATTDLQPLEEDVVLQFDAFGDSLSFWAWRPGERRPRQPLVSVSDSTLTAPGEVGIDYYLLEPDENLGSAVYRYVHVANASIPEPSTATLSAIFFAGVFAWQWRRSR